MSVYKHTYRAYSGRVTSPGTRILVLARYGFAEAWASKITIAICVLCLLPCLVSLIGIYLANNPIARMMIGGQGARDLSIDSGFFFKLLEIQSWLALVLASWIAPRTISFDLADNALPILLSHPISRFSYVFGKFLALLVSLSFVTWVPCLLLFAYESYSSPQPWGRSHLSVAVGTLAGSLLWIVFIAIFGLALSSWVKWRVVATGTIFAAIFVPAGIGAIVSAVLRTRWGLLFNIPYMMSVLWQRMLGAPEFFVKERWSLPTSAILIMLTLVSLLGVAMLNARIRAREVVRG